MTAPASSSFSLGRRCPEGTEEGEIPVEDYLPRTVEQA